MILAASGLRNVHQVVAWLVVGTNGVAGVWALAAHYRPDLRSRYIWWTVIVAETLVFAQAAIGVGIQSAEDLEPDDMHYLYGFSLIIGVAILYGYRQQMEKQRYLLYGGGSLFLMGMAIRAMFLGS